MYASDSFFTLSAGAQVGLLLVSLVMAGATAGVLRRVVRDLPLLLRVAGAIFSLWLFVWLSPQGYYAYYRSIIDGLPAQIVIKFPPDMQDILYFLTFSGAHSLSAHGVGMLGWGLVAVAVWPRHGPSKER